MFERIKAILVKEFKQVFRDPRMKMIIFVSPIVQLLIFGYAATMDLTHIPTAVYDLDNTPETREIIRAFTASKYFTIKQYIYSDKEQRDLIDQYKVNAVLRFNRGFANDLIANNQAKIQMIVDGSDSNSAGVILNYAGSIMENYTFNRISSQAKIHVEKVGIPMIDLRDRAWYNENLISRNYYLPGVIAMIVSIMSLLLSSMAIVREKEIGTMEQLIVSPIKPIELIVGKLVPFAVIACVQVMLITSVGVLWFGVPIRGNLGFLFLCTFVYLFTTLGVGLFISTLCATQQEAMMSVFLFYFPAVLLSGFAYPIQNMPVIIQYITILNPLRYFLYIVRSIFLKGIGITILWPELLTLAVIGVAVITLSASRFKKTIG